MKPGSILKWRTDRFIDRPRSMPLLAVQSSQYIVIKQKGNDWLLYDVEDGELFLANSNWVNFRLEEVK